MIGRDVQKDIITLKEPIEQFFAVKIQENKNGKFNVLIPKPLKEDIDVINTLKPKQSEKVATVLGMLELTKIKIATISQRKPFGKIVLKRRDAFANI